MAKRATLWLAGTAGLLLLSVVPGTARAEGTEPPALGAAAPKATPVIPSPKVEAKVEAKAEAKVEAKVEAKPAPTTNPPAKAPAKDAPATAPGKAAEAEATAASGKSAKAAAKPAAHKKTVTAKDAKPRVGEGPSPATPPPLTIGGLRDEIRREAGPVTIDPAAPARTKVEQMLAEIARTRESLREATSRLEGMMGEGAESVAVGAPAGAGPGPGAAAGPGKPAAKNPLDVLAKALRGIKPEQAAPIVARLDKRLAATVLLRMPPVDAGKIMGALKPDTAAELATQISMRVTPGEVKR